MIQYIYMLSGAAERPEIPLHIVADWEIYYTLLYFLVNKPDDQQWDNLVVFPGIFHLYKTGQESLWRGVHEYFVRGLLRRLWPIR